MGDFLVKLGRSRVARRVIRTLRLPVPLPQELRRDFGPWQERPLEGLPVVVGECPGAELASVLDSSLAAAGAKTRGVEDRTGSTAALAPSEGGPADDVRPHGLVFDATGMAAPQDLRRAYDFFHSWIRRLGVCGRVVVLARPPAEAPTPKAATAARALDGFVRSIAREIGRRGSTAQTVYVGRGSEHRIEPVLRFLLSARSAYISGQAIHLSTRVRGDSDGRYVRPLDGKVALVTGVARGIGAATARALAREGAHVVGADRPAEAEAAGKLVGEIGGTFLPCDISDAEAPGRISKLLEEHSGGVDVVVHNAGITRDRTLGNMDAQLWDQALGVNLIAAISVNEALEPLLRREGRIVFLSSVSGIAGNVGQTNYAASKAGAIGYVQALAPKLADGGVAVNAVAPGFIETALTAAIPLGTRLVARRLCCLSQGGQPEDVAEVITFLASPGAAGMTGQVLRVCGGSFIGA